MKKVVEGIHFYININNLNGIIKKDEKMHDDLRRVFHAIQTFIATIEKFAIELNIEVEKFTSSRLHFYLPCNENDYETKAISMLELVVFSRCLATHMSTIGKYQSLANFTIGAGADLGLFTTFEFADPDSEIEEMTTIGSPANRAAKLQSLCEDGKILVSKEIYDILPKSLHSIFYGDGRTSALLAVKYTELTAYKATINEIKPYLSEKYCIRETRCLNFASEIANKTNFSEINFSEAKAQIDFSFLSLANSKYSDDSVVLFSDIRGFTNKVDNGNLSDIKQLTQTVLSGMNKAVRKHQGSHVQFQGDRESAIFNRYNDETHDFAFRAILSAMKMLDMVDEINSLRPTDKLNIGIGCAFGNIFGTRVGLRGRKFNVIMGQTVKAADTAEDEVAGAHIENASTEIAITSELFDYLLTLPDKQAKFIKSNFVKRSYAGKSYYICTTRFSKYQNELDNVALKQNSTIAKNNYGIKPWGI